MALARIARNGLRWFGSIGSYASHSDTTYEGLSTCSYSRKSVGNVIPGHNMSYLTSMKKVDQTTFGSRGISVTPHYQFAQAGSFVDESDSEYDYQNYPNLEATKAGEKPRVVVLGTGWAGCRFLKGIDTKIYDVVCISPRNHMVFTPLLASTCVGTLEFRSVAEPVTRIQSMLAKNPKSYFYLATCTYIDMEKHEVFCEIAADVGLPDKPYRFKVSYDKLVIAAGSESLIFVIGHCCVGTKQDSYEMIVTEESEGCRYYTKEFKGRVSGLKVKAVDTTGAGDAFVGAILNNLASDWNLYMVNMLINTQVAFVINT
ncbi:hypothetical protein AgCh_020603 [Apium graveolens]